MLGFATAVRRIVLGAVGPARRHRRAACAGHVGRRRPVPDGRPRGLCRRRPAPDRRHALRLLLRAAAPAVHLPDLLGDHLHADDLAAVDRAAGAVAVGLLRRDRSDGVLRRCGCLVAPDRRRRGRSRNVRGIVVTVTALGLWLEPVRTTFNYGQINLFLCALLLAGAVAGKEWLAGASVGIAAGIKLTPAITGLYYLLQKRWSAVIWSVVFFAADGRPSALALLPSETWRFFTKLMLDPGADRAGLVGDQPIPAGRAGPARRRGSDLRLVGLRGRRRRARGLGCLGVPAGRGPGRRAARRAVHRPADLARSPGRTTGCGCCRCCSGACSGRGSG